MRIVYIANNEAAENFRKMAKICPGVKVGILRGAGKDDYLARLGENISTSLDAVIIDRDGLYGLYDDDQISSALRAYDNQEVLDKTAFYLVARYGMDEKAAETIPVSVKIIPDIADADIALEPLRGKKIAGIELPNYYAVDNIPTEVEKSVYNPFTDPDTINQAIASDDNNPFADFDIVGDPFAVIPPQSTNNFPFQNQMGGNGGYANQMPSQPSMPYGNGMGNGIDFAFQQPLQNEPVHHLSYDEYQNITDGFNGDLSDSDLKKLLSINEPEWDYSLAKEDLRAGKKFKKNAMSQVNEYTLANSAYIREQEEINGSYMPSDEAKIITVHATKGGNGKTTVSVMIATQLNWYFNRDVLLGRTQSISSRVMILSLNEFDDLSTHDIGEVNNLEETSGRNVLELKQIIEATHGSPQWDDISHCFSVSPHNFIFYLPSMTLKDKFTTGISITADDYRKIIEVCSRFFNYIVLDCPDMFAEQKEDLMTFAYNISDIICMIIEADQRSTVNLFNLLKGLESDTNRIPLNPKKCLLVVNKYATGDNPYRGVTPKHDQIPFNKIAKATRKFFAHAVAIPLSEYRSYGNVLNGTDPVVKKAAAELADTVLEMIDDNDKAKEQSKYAKR